MITPQARPLDFLIAALHEPRICKKIIISDTISNMQLSYINPKPHEGNIMRGIIDHTIGVRFYPPPGSEHYKLL